MSIEYTFYKQGSTQMVSFASNAATSSTAFNSSCINHISLVANTSINLLITHSGSIVAVTTLGTGLGQPVNSNEAIIIPCVKAVGCSISGRVAAGTAWITEFLEA